MPGFINYFRLVFIYRFSLKESVIFSGGILP